MFTHIAIPLELFSMWGKARDKELGLKTEVNSGIVTFLND